MTTSTREPREIITSLCSSFSVQIEHYKTLHDRTQKILSKLILSRGDVSPLRAAFDEKQVLLEAISAEREKIKPSIVWWQENKESLGTFTFAKELDALLVVMEKAIKKFLESEDQLERHLAKLAKVSTPS